MSKKVLDMCQVSAQASIRSSWLSGMGLSEIKWMQNVQQSRFKCLAGIRGPLHQASLVQALGESPVGTTWSRWVDSETDGQRVVPWRWLASHRVSGALTGFDLWCILHMCRCAWVAHAGCSKKGITLRLSRVITLLLIGD